MCCFSGPRGRASVEKVSATRIFARGDGPRQKLAYSMRLAAREPVAMILPLPVAPGTREADVRFIDLSGYPAFFDALEDAFRPPDPSDVALMGAAPRRGRLAVHRVGRFVASFAPSLWDLDRLDPRFRLSPGVFEPLPEVSSRGFAVFQLEVEPGRDELIHPMALDFPRADPDRLFFPTLHVHDGELHAEAEFDHVLYLQAPALTGLGGEWRAASHAPGAVSATEMTEAWLDLPAARGLVKAGQPLARRALTGRLPNEDHWVAA